MHILPGRPKGKPDQMSPIRAAAPFPAAYPVTVEDMQTGDLIYEAWGRTGGVGSSTGISHVTMHIGNDQVIEAARSAMDVCISLIRFHDPAFVGIRRIPAGDWLNFGAVVGTYSLRGTRARVARRSGPAAGPSEEIHHYHKATIQGRANHDPRVF